MLFSSSEFLLVFLPLTVAVFYASRGLLGARPRVALLIAASVFFYGYWKAALVPVLLASILFNQLTAAYFVGATDRGPRTRRNFLICAIGVNLGVLFYFKYFAFFTQNVAQISGLPIGTAELVLPLGISFYTFQQIAYQVDVYQGKAKPARLLEYALFVSFFPQLIAGPIVHHREMMPQFAGALLGNRLYRNLAVGLSIFALGLFKKVCIADQLAPDVNLVFDRAAAGAGVDFYSAWVAAVGYAMQLYFDFSGYSDMAIGLARLFGIKLPLNFFSPYKALDPIDFWRRWHMTLSRFLRDYVYIPLGGNRRGEAARYRNILIAMLLGGVWHGAGWTFFLWGAYHGVLIVINHALGPMRTRLRGRGPAVVAAARLATFFLVTLGWVLFRAENLATAQTLLMAMFGAEGLSLPYRLHGFLGQPQFLEAARLGVGDGLAVFAAFLITQLLPNTFEVMRRYDPAFDFYRMRERTAPATNRVLEWRPRWQWAGATAILLLIAIGVTFSGQVEFLYYDF